MRCSRRAGSQIGTARARPAGTFISVQRQCARSGCSAVATATFTFDAREQTVWLDAPRDGNARAGELCERHANSLTPPQGWRLDDRRGVVPSSTAPVPTSVPAAVPALAAAPEPVPAVAAISVAPDEHCPAPHELPTPALDLLLRARTPLLARVRVRRQSLRRRARSQRVPVRHREQLEELAVRVAHERADADVRVRQHLAAVFGDRAPAHRPCRRRSTRCA